MPHYDAGQIAEMLSREEKRVESRKAGEIVLDKSNKVTFPNYPYTFEATGDRLLVAIDVFRSGYECKSCGGTKKLTTTCQCEMGDRPGYKYSTTMLDAFGVDNRAAREEIKCADCGGDYKIKRTETVCPDCKGRGQIIFIPESAKTLPTTGVIVSRGEYVVDKAKYCIGTRVLFGPYAGHFLPTKEGTLLKVIDEAQALLVIEGGNNLGAFDFILKPEDQ